MKRLLYILILFALPAKAQLLQSFGGTRGTDTAYTPNSLRFDKVLKAPYYITAGDTVLPGITGPLGIAIKIPLSFIRSFATSGTITQSVLNDTAAAIRLTINQIKAQTDGKIAASVQYADTLPGVGHVILTQSQINNIVRGPIDSTVTGQTWNSSTKVLSTTRRGATATTVTLTGVLTAADSATFATKAYVYNSSFTVTIASTTRQITDSRLSGRDVQSLYYAGMTFIAGDFTENDNVIEMQGTRYFRAGNVVQINLK